MPLPHLRQFPRAARAGPAGAACAADAGRVRRHGQRLLARDIGVEDVLFISALRVAREVAEPRRRLRNVDMVAFDFRPEPGYAHVAGRQFGGGGDAERALVIDLQKNYFLTALYILRDSGLQIFQVGTRACSWSAAEKLIDLFRRDRRQRPDERYWTVAVIAELPTNHFGDRGWLELMVRAARAAGADFVKVQKRNVETFAMPEQLAAF